MWFLNRRPKTKKILLISSTTESVDNEDTFDYFASIISELAFAIQNRFPDFDLVIKVPKGPPKGAVAQQILFIENAINAPDPFECIIVSPIDRRSLYAPLKDWIGKYGDSRLIFIDQGFDARANDPGFPNIDYEYFHAGKVPRPPFVQADWVKGGCVAGLSMLEFFTKNSIKCPHIVLMEGHVGSSQRIEGFQSALKAASVADPHFQPTYHPLEGGYSQKAARQSFELYLKDRINENRSIDAVFSANDEMALGVRDALVANKDDYKSAFGVGVRLPIIIGFDGIKDLTFHIDIRDDFIYDTVNVQLKRQIESLSAIVEKVIMKDQGSLSRNEKFVLMECVSYRKLKGIT